MAAEDDPRGLYRALGLTPNATQAQISHAYRQRAKTFHPDLSGNPDAGEFYRIKDAYDTLHDESRRNRYDSTDRNEKSTGSRDHQSPAGKGSAPIHCSACDAIPAQPRYCVFDRVISTIVYCRRDHPQGVYCPGCAAKRAFRESAICLLFGWWAIFGAFRTPIALWRNFWIGAKPDLENAHVLIAQARYFLSVKNEILADSCLRQAAQFADAVDAETLIQLGQSVRHQIDRPLRNEWAVYRHLTSYGYGVALLFAAVLFLSFNPLQAVSPKIVGSSPASTPPSDTSTNAKDAHHVATPSTTIWIERDGKYISGGYLPQFATVEILRPSGNTAFVDALLPNGQSVTLASAALAGGTGAAARLRLCQNPTQTPLRNNEILRKVRSGPNRAVVNNTGSSEAVVKFRDQDGTVAIALFIDAESQATIENFPDGSYKFEFATGLHWNRKCGFFEQGMSTQRFRLAETFASRESVEVKQGKHVIVAHSDFAAFTIPTDQGGTTRSEPLDQDTFIRD